ncbi:MAG: hypothetical protein A2Y79_10275 [Deltaproteobacteria bacterium RBG_13_43_22]|jgi:hypothetical protein|nr:MAG: hypothetical protein A2Y79_10275 [Deltaproteobacteria bacterium RBG_13_43_22]
MNWATPIQYLRDHLKALKWILYLVMAAAVIFSALIPHPESHDPFEKTIGIPGFWSVFGLICCILLIRIMKGLAHTVLMKKEDFYG